MLSERLERRTDEVKIAPVLDAAGVVALQRDVESIHVSEDIGRYVVALVHATRTNAQVLVGASPRGSLAIVKLARARAALNGRDFVVPEDVKAVAPPALGHRLVLRAELWVRQVRGEDVVRAILDEVPTPSASDLLHRPT
jgi:MoxR-like ATPase